MTLSRNTPSASLTPISITPTTLADLAPQFPSSDPNPNNPQIRQTGTYDDSFTISTSYTAAVNTITYTATADYTTGAQLQDSAGSLSGTPVQAGVKQVTTSITAIYPYFWGVSDTSQPGGIDFEVNGYANSISSVASAIAAGTGLGYNKELALSSGTLTIPFNTTAGTTWMWFAYPAVNTNKTKWFETVTNKGDIGGTDFTDPNRNLYSAPSTTSITTSLWGPINYNIHIALKSAGTTTIELRNN